MQQVRSEHESSMARWAKRLDKGQSGRYVYRLAEPPSPSALAAIQAAGAALLLTLINARRPKSDQGAEQLHSRSETRKAPDDTGWGKLLQANTVVKAGMEIGFWTFLANSATISAFEHTPASRGAFLIRQARF